MTGTGPKPPGAPETQACEYVKPNDEPCGNVGGWLLPEYPLCRHHWTHVPIELAQVRDRRRARWEAEAAELWQRILREERAQ